MSLRRFDVLVRNVPADSCLIAVEEPDPFPGWGNTEELLANLVEIVDVGNRLFYMAHAKKGTRQPRPIEVPRPWRKKERRMSTTAELVKFFGASATYVPTGGEG